MQSLKTVLNTLWRTDARLTAFGLVMIAVLAATTVALIVDPRQILGAPAWMKPAKFAVSFAIYTLTLAWVFTFLPEWKKTRRLVSWVTVTTLVLEIVLIDMQAGRGTTSHFNTSTLFDTVVFLTMGLAIVVQTLSTVAVAVALWQQTFADRALGWALRLGMTITIVGALTGGLMTRPTAAQLEEVRTTRHLPVSGAHTVGAPDGGPGLPGVGWSVDHGDIRIAHFIGLHALQILPIFALVLVRRGVLESPRTRMVWSIAASHFALFSLLLWQAFRGQSITRPDGLTLAAFGAWAFLTLAGAWLSLAKSRSIRVHAVVS